MAEPARQPKKTIRQLREARGWSRQTLARQLGVATATVAGWERGSKLPLPRSRMRLADLFGVSVEVIAFGPAEQP